MAIARKIRPSPGYPGEFIYAFLAQDLNKLEKSHTQDEDEEIEVILMSFEEFEQAIIENKPIDAKSITSYFWMKLVLGLK